MRFNIYTSGIYAGGMHYMNIRRIVTNGLALGVCLTTVSLCGLSLKENQDKSIKSIRQNMEYVKANAPEKYKE